MRQLYRRCPLDRTLTNPERGGVSGRSEVPVGVSVEGGGGRRSVVANLNLVPFIDLLSTLIVFLISTAVWVELTALSVDQPTAGPPGAQTAPPPLPLTIHLRAEGVWVGRTATAGRFVPRDGAEPAWRGVERELVADRSANPGATDLVLTADDGVPWRETVAALDLAAVHAYTDPVLDPRSPR